MRMRAGPRMTMNSDGKMQPTSGNSILIGALAACSSARCRRSIRSCSDWTWRTFEIDTPSCSAWMIAPMKFGERHDLGPRDDVAQRLATRLADADLGERPPELVRQRSLQLLDDLPERGVEAEPGPDRDRQQVERVRDHQQDGLLALLDPATEPELRGRCSRTGARPASAGSRRSMGRPRMLTTTKRRKNRIPPTIAPIGLDRRASRRRAGRPGCRRAPGVSRSAR